MDVVQQRPLRIDMDPRLLKAARSGDIRILDELLGPEVSSGASREAISIRVPDAATQIDTSVLLGVTLEGNTALHIVASLGHLELANEICQREISLLTAPNTMLDTPLHCAAKAGDDEMVSLLIRFAGEDEIEARRVLRAINWDDSNALHEAAKYAHTRVADVLMEKDPGLASMLNGAGMSPLYLAIVTESFDIAKVLLGHPRRETASPTFYAGPDGRTALHEAVLLSLEITKEILRQKPTLGKGVDSSGRIPLHYVASEGHHVVLKLLLEKDPSTANVPDANGSFPIHIAAGKGNVLIVDQILQQCPATDELLDIEGKNFLHAAFQKTRSDVVKQIISRRPHLRKLLNDQDKKGNTPLHTAVENRDTKSVHFLLRDKNIYLNIMNHDGITPLDLAYLNVDEGLTFVTNASIRILSCLALAMARFGPPALHGLRGFDSANDGARGISVKETSSSKQDQETKKELNLFRNFVISSVLIATVTFAAGFTLPGGLIADDHPRHGTAVLAKKYAFRVFVISDAFALFCSMLATCWLISTGTSAADNRTRTRILGAASVCLDLAFIGIFTAFAMGIYVVLAPSCKIISIFLCFVALGSPLLAQMIVFYNYCSLWSTTAARLGYRSWIYPDLHPLVERRLPRAFVRNRFLRYALIQVFGTYALFFLLALIKK